MLNLETALHIRQKQLSISYFYYLLFNVEQITEWPIPCFFLSKMEITYDIGLGWKSEWF